MMLDYASVGGYQSGMGNRKKLPAATQQIVLLESGYKCANPVCRHVLTLELHHIVYVRDDGSDDPENLLALCPNCHTLHHSGHIPRSAIEAWKALLVSIGNPNRTAVDLLLVLAEDEERVVPEGQQGAAKFRFSGDSLPFVAPLLTSKLVEISRRFSGLGLYGPAYPSFEVSLTAQGRRLVEAWKAGSPDAIKKALATG